MLRTNIKIVFYTSLLMALALLGVKANSLSIFVGPILIALLYVFAYAISQGLLRDVLNRLLITLMLSVLAALFWPLVIFAVLWAIYNIIEVYRGAVALIPQLLISLLLLGLDYCAIAGDFAHLGLGSDFFLSCYFLVALIYSYSIREGSLGFGLYRLSAMLASAALLVMALVALIAAIRNLLTVISQSVTAKVRMPQQVGGYMRGGIAVAGYTRSVSTTVTSLTTSVGTGPGTFYAAAAGASAKMVANTDTASSKGSGQAVLETASGLKANADSARGWLIIFATLGLLMLNGVLPPESVRDQMRAWMASRVDHGQNSRAKVAADRQPAKASHGAAMPQPVLKSSPHAGEQVGAAETQVQVESDQVPPAPEVTDASVADPNQEKSDLDIDVARALSELYGTLESTEDRALEQRPAILSEHAFSDSAGNDFAMFLGRNGHGVDALIYWRQEGHWLPIAKSYDAFAPAGNIPLPIEDAVSVISLHEGVMLLSYHCSILNEEPSPADQTPFKECVLRVDVERGEVSELADFGFSISDDVISHSPHIAEIVVGDQRYLHYELVYSNSSRRFYRRMDEKSSRQSTLACSIYYRESDGYRSDGCAVYGIHIAVP